MTDGPTGSESTAAWLDLLDALADSGATVARLADDVAEVDIAEGFRYVLTVLGDHLDRATMRASRRPEFLPAVTPVRKLFFDNPDTVYDTAQIRGDREYRIRGQRGSARYLAFCVYAGNAAKGEPTRVANLVDADMQFDTDGSFEIVLSEVPHGGNWIALEPDAHVVFARQYFVDRSTEQPASYTIEALDESGPDPVDDAARFARAARSTAAFLRTATEVAARRSEALRADPNRFVEVAGHGIYGTPDAGYVVCWYDLADDEALVVDVTPPRGRYWGVHLANRWGQSLDHRTRPTALNGGSASVAADGSLRVVVARRDPGEPNWLDTAGHPRGWVLFRWLLADATVLPAAHVVRIDP